MQFREGNETNKSLIRKDESSDRYLIPSITIYDIDYAILYQLQNKMKLTVQQNGVSVPVPVMFTSPEKWVQIQKYGGIIRTEDDKLTAPLILINRTAIQEDDNFIFNDVANTIVYVPPHNKADRGNNLSKTWNTNESKELLVTVIPTTVLIEYELMIWCNYQEQLNFIVEQILNFDQSLWGDVFQFTTDVGQISFETINNSGEDRVIKATIPLTTHGMLRNEFTALESDVMKSYTIKRVDFKNEWEQEDFTIDYETKPKRIPLKNRVTPFYR